MVKCDETSKQDVSSLSLVEHSSMSCLLVMSGKLAMNRVTRSHVTCRSSSYISARGMVCKYYNYYMPSYAITCTYRSTPLEHGALFRQIVYSKIHNRQACDEDFCQEKGQSITSALVQLYKCEAAVSQL
jgi:hypothetical protein